MKQHIKANAIKITPRRGSAGCWLAILLVLPLLAGVETTRAEPGLEPTRLYYQVDHAIPITVDGGDAAALEIVLLDPTNRVVERAALSTGSGTVDLAEKFPDIFELTTVHYAQLRADDMALGAALCLQPLVTRATPVLRYSGQGTARSPKVVNWQDPASDEMVQSGFRIYIDSMVKLNTTEGAVVLVMRPDEAPNTVWNFIHLVKNGFYTMIPFHRVVAMAGNGHPFVIQAGDPSGTGSGGCAYNIDLEPTKLPHDFGVISMARQGHDVNTGSSQFFLCLSREGTQFLDGQYTSFGQTVEGGDVIRKLAAVPVDARDRPRTMVYIQSAELVPAAPRMEGVTPNWMTTGEIPKAAPDTKNVDR